MAKPKTTYESGFPDIVFPGNLKEEANLQENGLLQRARDNNILSQEIKIMQGYFGAHPQQGWTIGQDTINDRIVRIGGTGSCWEGGTICNYSSIDPTGASVQKTGQLVHWTDPTGIPYFPPVPPGGTAGGAPWPGPGGAGPVNPNPGGPGGGPPGVNNPYTAPWAPWGGEVPDTFGPWVPPEDTDDTGDVNWNTKDFLQYINWKADTNMLRHEWASAESVALWPNEYADLFEVFTEIIELTDNWPTSRVRPQDLNPGRASIFDVLLGSVSVLSAVLNQIGIGVAVGTVSGSDITFTTTTPINGGRFGADPSVVSILANSSDGSFAKSNYSDVQTNPGGTTILGKGEQVAGDYKVVGSSAWDADAEVLVFYAKGLPHLATGGDETTEKSEHLTGGEPFNLSTTPVDDPDANPVLSVWARTGAGAEWKMLSYNGTSSSSEAFDYGISGTTIDVDNGSAYTELYVRYTQQI